MKVIRKICRVIKNEKVALIHSNGPQTNIPAGLAGRWMGIPIIWHARNLVKHGMIDLDRIIGFLPNQIFCNSEAIRSRFINNRTEKITKTIMNGVDLKNYDTKIKNIEIRERLGIPSTAKVVGMCSRLGKDKGHITLIKALARLKKGYPGIWALIVGGHVFEEDADVPKLLKAKATELGVADRVIFTGFRNDVSKLYAAMDIFVLGTDAEPCGRVIFEAMAMKKPVIGTNNGGTPEIVVDGKTGLLFNYGDDEELSDKINYLLKSQNLIKKMGAAGRKRVEENFTIDRNVQITQEKYFELLQV
jgi:glycosyltransferase involved in cell wall biosynthesis